MKITIFIGGLSGGGAERVVCNLSNHLVEHGYEVKLLTMADDQPSYVLDQNINRYILLRENERKNTVYNFFLRYKRLKKFVKNNKTDVYIVFLPITTILLLWFRRYISVPILASERNDPSRMNTLIKVLIKRLIHRADGVIFQTQDALEWYKLYLKKAKTVIIPNAINRDFLNAKPYDTNKRREIIASVGRLTEQKNYKLLIKAFAVIKRDYSNYELIIYGEGNQRAELLELAKMLNVSEHVKLPGYVNNISDRLQEVSMFVLSSNYEGIPNALIEAMCLGIPCIATDCPVGGPKSLIKDRENGILIPVNNQNEMVNAIKLIINNKTLAKTIGDNARAIINDLSPDIIYNKWEEFINLCSFNGTESN